MAASMDGFRLALGKIWMLESSGRGWPIAIRDAAKARDLRLFWGEFARMPHMLLVSLPWGSSIGEPLTKKR